MRYWLLAATLVTFLGVGTACHAEPPKETMTQMVKAGATLLDVRTAQEFSQGHLPGAINISVAVLADNIARLPKDKPVVVYCRSGQRSARAARLLSAQGFQVFDLGSIKNGL